MKPRPRAPDQPPPVTRVPDGKGAWPRRGAARSTAALKQLSVMKTANRDVERLAILEGGRKKEQES